MPEDGVLIFPTRRGAMMSEQDWRNWRNRIFGPLAAAAGINESRPYDLRHSFASLLIREGASPVEVAAQLGNAPSVTLDTYAHLFEGNVTGPSWRIRWRRSKWRARVRCTR